MLSPAARLCRPRPTYHHLTQRWYSAQKTGAAAVATAVGAKDAGAKSAAAASDKQTPISPLRRPLGVPDLPTTQKRTFAEKTADFLNQDKQLEKRRHLVREASTGYFYDLHMMRVNGGKIWMAPQVLIREEKALYFPNITGSRLDNGVKEHTASICAGKVSVVAILTTQMSEVHVNSYVKRVNERFRGHPGYQFVQINLQENVLKAILVNVFLSSLRSKVPLNLQTRYLVTRQNMDYLREQIGMTNNRIGYVYLVDENMKIRWAACADAWAEEEAALVRCAGVLLSRHKDRQKAPTRISDGKQGSEEGSPSTTP